MTPAESYARLRRNKTPHATLLRLQSEISAIRERYGSKLIAIRGKDMKPLPYEKAVQRDRAVAQVARYFEIYIDALLKSPLDGEALNARRVLMGLLSAEVRMTQAQIATFLGTDQPTVSKGIAIAKNHHNRTMAEIRGRIERMQ